MAGGGAGVCISADSAAAEAEKYRALAGVRAAAAGFEVDSLLSVEKSAEHSEPAGRCYNFLAESWVRFWA